MHINLNKKDAVNILKIFLAAFIPVAIGIFLLVDYISGVEMETSRRITAAEQKQRIDTIEYIIKTKVESNIDDLMVIKDSQEMADYKINSTEENKNNLAELFVRIANNKTEFDQIRLIDNSGNEVIRVNNRILKEPYVVKKQSAESLKLAFKIVQKSIIPKHCPSTFL